MSTTCKQETRYLLSKAMLSRGVHVVVPDDYALEGRTAYGSFRLTVMPGNRRVLISSHVYIREEFRGQGRGRQMLQWREEIAKEAGCNLILATVREDNLAEVHLLETGGWKRYNKRDTGVCLWGKEL